MTEKRFTINLKMESKREWLLNNYAIAKLTDNSDKTFYFIIDSVDEIENLCKKINSLVDENEQLKQRVNLLSDEITAQGIVIEGYQNRNQRLFDENEQLKKIKKRYDETIVDWNALKSEYDDLSVENEQLKKEKEYWKSNGCSQSNYLSILSMDCRIVEEGIFNLKNVIDVDTEAYNLLDELSDKFNELQEHRINWGYNLSEEEKQDVIKYLRAYND